jgi:hypothetical protein
MVNAAHPENSASGNGIAVHDLNIGVPQPGAQRAGEFIIGFNCGQTRYRGSQAVRSNARARTGFQDVRPKLSAGEHPWHPMFQRPFPTSRATEPAMQLIQEFSSARTVATC